MAVAGIFALHPMQSQAVSYVSQRSEVLASGLYLATLLLLLRAGRPGAWPGRTLAAAGALVLFILGMGAKPIVATAPLAWLLLFALVPPAGTRREPMRRGRALLLLAPLVVVGALLVQGALRSVAGRPDAGFSVPGMTPWTYFLTQWRAVATYVRLLAWPAGQNADWTFPASRGLGEPAVLGAGAFLAALLVGAALLWRRSRSGTDRAAADGRAAAFGVAWFFLLLSPTSTFLPIADVLVEHRVYLASWGLFLAAVLGGERLVARVAPGRRDLVAGVAVGAVWVLLAVALHRRNAVWETELAFWTDVVAKSPTKARPYLGLGVAKGRQGTFPARSSTSGPASSASPGRSGRGAAPSQRSGHRPGSPGSVRGGRRSARAAQPSIRRRSRHRRGSPWRSGHRGRSTPPRRRRARFSRGSPAPGSPPGCSATCRWCAATTRAPPRCWSRRCARVRPIRSSATTSAPSTPTSAGRRRPVPPRRWSWRALPRVARRRRPGGPGDPRLPALTGPARSLGDDQGKRDEARLSGAWWTRWVAFR